ncbi:hypothetical protein TIFTF001_034320 [Ficus carica]|uniref:Uncharacterized protein n=1 Tax=Ficus carica TaxID=3494 RepID=A0AA88JAG2_FICCA|nr:hypothetical protein TIFTF001_034320 [Ficus carica]
MAPMSTCTVWVSAWTFPVRISAWVGLRCARSPLWRRGGLVLCEPVGAGLSSSWMSWCPPSSAKMLMPEMVPAATPNVFPAGPDARGDPAGSATLGTRSVRRSVGATGLIDGRHVALGPGHGRRLRLVGCQYNQCQITNDHLGHNMEAGAGAILAEGVRALRAVATRVPGSDSYCLLGQIGIPKAAAIRAEKAVRWSEMI